MIKAGNKWAKPDGLAGFVSKDRDSIPDADAVIISFISLGAPYSGAITKCSRLSS